LGRIKILPNPHILFRKKQEVPISENRGLVDLTGFLLFKIFLENLLTLTLCEPLMISGREEKQIDIHGSEDHRAIEPMHLA
jgi:hypothetical protein